MDVNSIISQVAASSTIADVALEKQATESAALAALTNVSAGDSNLLESLFSQTAGQTPTLPTSGAALSLEPGVGQNIDALA